MADNVNSDMLNIDDISNISDINAFIRYLTDKNSSPSTVAAYRHDVYSFAEYIRSEQISSLRNVTQINVLEFLHISRGASASVSKMNRTISALRAFYGFLFDNKLITENPTRDLHNFKAEENLPVYLNEYQINMFLSAPDPKTVKGSRDRAILELLYATGIKVSELIRLKLSDINLKVGFIRCFSKKDKYKDKYKERIIPIYSYAKECIKEYIDKRDTIVGAEKNDILFLNLSGNPMSRQGIWKMIKYYDKKSGISADISPQIIRHTIAVHMLKNGYDIKNVKEMMGHSGIYYTQIYEKALNSQISEEYNNAHPRAKYNVNQK